jgi:predicted Fe-Mo cluster-binding NifX family protein
MKIAVTSNGNDLSAQVDPRFGRCDHFIIIDPETMAFDVLDNKQSLDLPQGAGIQAGKTIANAQANVLITGNCGPKAFSVLDRAGIQVVTGATGTITEVVQKFQNGDFQSAKGANVDGHWM